MIFDDITKGIKDLLSKEEKEIKESSPITEGPSPSQLFTSYIKTGNEIFKEAAGEAFKTMKENAVPMGTTMLGVGAMMTPKGRAIAGKTVFEGFKDISSTALEKLAGKSVVSRQFIEDSLKQAGTRAADADMIRAELAITPGNKIDVAEFANRVKENQILPITVVENLKNTYSKINLPTGKKPDIISNYKENIYQSPIETEAGKKHFADTSSNYFAHTRTQDANNVRQVLEVQSDLFQKGGLDKEVGILYPTDRMVDDMVAEKGIPYKDAYFIIKRQLEENPLITKLSPYSNTWHERIVREEVKRAAMDGMEKVQFPTGETAMRIEKLAPDNSVWRINKTPIDKYGGRTTASFDAERATSDNLKVGQQLHKGGEGEIGHEGWVITDILGDGKFKAMRRTGYDSLIDKVKADGITKNLPREYLDYAKKEGFDYDQDLVEFNLSDKVDTKHPIYQFYDKEMKKFLTNKFNAKEVTDEKGVTWLEVTPKAYKDQPVMAHGMASMDTILKGGMASMGGIVGAGAVAGTVDKLFSDTQANSTPPVAEPILSDQSQETTQAQPAQQPETTEETAVESDIRKEIKDAVIYRENRGAIFSGQDPYTVVGPTGDLGKYQVSPSTLSNWSESWLGKKYTPEEFKKDPTAQEEFFKQFLDVVDAYGVTKDEALVMWHRGFGVLGEGEKETRPERLRKYLDKTMKEEKSKNYLNPGGEGETSFLFQKALAANEDV